MSTSTTLPKIILSKGKEKSLLRKHPWIFSGAVFGISQELADGDLVEVVSSEQNYLGTGMYSNRGSIAVRMLTFAPEIFDDQFWINRLQNAWAMRMQIIDIGKTNAFRLIHGEGDGISGLIIDYYDGHFVLQAHTTGIYHLRHDIANAICNVFDNQCKTIYCKSAQTLSQLGTDEFLFGDTTDAIVKENNIKFKIDWVTGQKTGFFLDQRENRLLLSQFVKDKLVLNTFCYTGGFSVYALKHGAKHVTSVDISTKAIELTTENIALNHHEANHDEKAQDVFEFLKENSNVFEVIVLDPPAFAKNIKNKHTATQAYKRLNLAGIEHIAKGGIIFTYSCSQVIDESLFYHTIAAAAIESGRNVRVLQKMTQGADHPVSMYHPEGAYLKGLVLYVD